jgi:PAS domain S-box-containing protein
MPVSKKPKNPIKTTPDPQLNSLMEEILSLQQEEKERQAFSQRVGRIGTFTWNVVTNESTWTQEFEALYGFPNGGFKGGFNYWAKCVHPADRKRVHNETNAALKDKNQDELNIEFRVIWPDESVHYLLTRARIIRDDNGKALEVSGVNIDISERKQLEINLHYLSEASKTLASSLNYHDTLKAVAALGVPEICDWCAVDVLEDNGTINRLAVAHIDPKKVKWAWDLYKKDPPRMDKPSGVTQVLTTGESVFIPVVTDEMLVANAKNPEELALLRKINFASVMIIPLVVEGKSFGALTFVSTESKRHFSQADLSVAEEVANRAALAIHNARLFTDSQNAIAIRDEFISVASHELKTPVTSLKMYTQIVLRQLEKQNDQILTNPVSKMNAQIDKLTMLINDLLNISKIQLGKLEFNEESFDLQTVLEDTIESVQPSTQTHTISLKGNIKKQVWGDKDRINQVITNLLTNAIKYSPQADKVQVIISEQKDKALVTVKDFGIGIEPEQQKKIFNRFYRVSGLEEKTFPGLGIGLYISSEIIRRHGGKISVSSVKGKGSEFSFTLPYKKPKTID